MTWLDSRMVLASARHGPPPTRFVDVRDTVFDATIGNWIPTVAGRRFWVAVRFYGPEPALLDRSWVLPDVEHV